MAGKHKCRGNALAQPFASSDGPGCAPGLSNQESFERRAGGPATARHTTTVGKRRRRAFFLILSISVTCSARRPLGPTPASGRKQMPCNGLLSPEASDSLPCSSLLRAPYALHGGRLRLTSVHGALLNLPGDPHCDLLKSTGHQKVKREQFPTEHKTSLENVSTPSRTAFGRKTVTVRDSACACWVADAGPGERRPPTAACPIRGSKEEAQSR